MHHSEIRNSSTVFTTLETGTGEPVLFLHGFPDNHKTFAPIMEVIGKRVSNALLLLCEAMNRRQFLMHINYMWSI